MRSLKNIIALLLIVLPIGAIAEESVHPEVSSKYTVDLGVFFPDRDMTLGAGVATRGPRGVDFSTQFDLEKSDEIFAIDFNWRFGEKWSFAAQHFQLSAEGEAVLQEDLEWKGVVFGAGSSAVGSTDFKLYRIVLGRSFGSNERTDFGIGAGLHWMDISASIQGNILVGDGVALSVQSVTASAPLPNITAWYMHSLSPKWALRARADWFSASVDEFDGSLVNLQFGVNYALFDKAGIGAAYNYFEVDAGVDSSTWRGNANIVYKGPFVFMSVYW